VQNFNYAGAVAPIPDNDRIGVNTTINVSGVTGAIQDLNFIITGTAATPADLTGIDHSYIGDLEVYLTSPAGTRVLLIDSINSGTTILGTCGSNNIFNTTLDDAAATSIDLACPGNTSAGPLTGTFKPQNPLSAFNTQNPNGTWTLNVRDTDFEDTGSVRAYRLAITPGTAACQSKVWTGAVSSDWNNANNWSPAGVPVASDSVVIPATGVTNNPTISAANVTVANLTVVSPRVLTVNAGRTLNVTGTALINGTLTITGTALLGASPGLTGSNVIFNGSSAQTIPALPYNNLTINNLAGTTLSGATTVNGILTLTNGIVNTGANTLTLANCATAAISGGSAASHIRGALSRCAGSLGIYNYPVGTANGYSPVDADVTVLRTNPSALIVKANQSAIPGGYAATSLKRYWDLTETGDLTAALTFNYLPGDVSGNESTYVVYKREAVGQPLNACTVTSVCTPGTNKISITNVSDFSMWSAGNVAAPTAGEVTIGGRAISAKGRGISNVTITLTDAAGVVRTARTTAFGRYRFTNVIAGQTYVMTARGKRFSFSQPTQVLNIGKDTPNIDFTANP
jgi:subtilisin-like proprotein convertase family protein